MFIKKVCTTMKISSYLNLKKLKIVATVNYVSHYFTSYLTKDPQSLQVKMLIIMNY